LPIDIVQLCRAAGVAIRIEKAVKGKRRGVLTHEDGTPTAVIYRKDERPHALAPAERFTIAHELAHHYIDSMSGFQPTRQSEYWRCEEICNSFAQRVLLPARQIGRIGNPTSARVLFTIVRRIAQRADVTMEPAARAALLTVTTPSAIGRIRVDPHGTTNRIGFRDWWVQLSEGEVAISSRKAIYEGDWLSDVLNEMSTMEIGEIRDIHKPGTRDMSLTRDSRTTGCVSALLPQ
jgi:hypothetical protein